MESDDAVERGVLYSTRVSSPRGTVKLLTAGVLVLTLVNVQRSDVRRSFFALSRRSIEMLYGTHRPATGR